MQTKRRLFASFLAFMPMVGKAKTSKDSPTTRPFILPALLLLFCLPIAIQASAILTSPPGLNPGDQYRIAFVTVATHDAMSSDINDYNAFVNTVANAPGSLIQPLAATWVMIGSTSTVSAAANIGGVSSLPIYLLDGDLVANGTADLFDGTLTTGIGLSDDGIYGRRVVWTGTRTDGSSFIPLALGFGTPFYGLSDLRDFNWVAYSIYDAATPFSLYGISNTLTVPGGVPEPGTAGLALTGFILIAALMRKSSICVAQK